jgi:hypothetical protein
MKTQEEFLEVEIEEFESPEFQTELNQLSNERKNDILFKRLLFDYDEELQISLKKFIKSDGTVPAWQEIVEFYPELKYIYSDQPDPVNIAKIALKETSLHNLQELS